MAEKMASERQYSERDYVLGRIKLPPDVLSLPSMWFCYADDTDNILGAQVANGATATIPIQIDDSAYFLVEAIQMISSLQTVLMDKVTVQITDTTTSRPWSDAPVPMRDFAGKGDSPKYLSDPQIVRPTGTLAIQITNNSGAAAAFYVALIGRKIYNLSEGQANLLMRRSWFQYIVPFNSGLGASAIGTKAQVKVVNDSDFLVKRILSQQLINSIFALTGGALSNEVMLQLRDTNGDRNYFSNKTPARLVLGSLAGAVTSVANSWSNGAAMCLIKPILIRRNSILQVQLDNKSTTAISTAFNVTLEGIRIFDAV